MLSLVTFPFNPNRQVSPFVPFQFSISDGLLFECSLSEVELPFRGAPSVSISVFGMDLDERRQRVDDGVVSSGLFILLSGKFRWKETEISRKGSISRFDTRVVQRENQSLLRFHAVFASFRFIVHVYYWFFLAVSKTKVMEDNFASVRIWVSDFASLMNMRSSVKLVCGNDRLM
ncbi:hypothetical protein V6N13_147748 [Hibiscus sabdariffa]